MESFYPIFWILGTGLLYAAVGFLLLLLLEAAKYRSPKMLFGSVLSLAPCVALLAYVDLPSPIRFALVLTTALAGLYAGFLLGPKRVTDWQRLKQRRQYIRKVTFHLVLLTGAAVFMVPFVWLVTTSLKEEDQIFKYPPVWIPTRHVELPLETPESADDPARLSLFQISGQTVRVAEIEELDDGRKKIRILPDQPGAGMIMDVERTALTPMREFGLKWGNYPEALDYLPEETHKGLLYLWNTVYITLLAILGTLLSSSMVAYSFARLRWPGRDALFLVLLATMMIPAAVTMVPVFLIFRALDWVDTLRPLWIPAFFGGGFSVFLLRQFFLTIPTDLEDAAKIDGCSYFGIYWRIMLPLIKPALAALTIFTFMGQWNNFMGPLIYISSPEKMTLAYGLQLFSGAHGGEYGLLMAASTLVMLPVLIVFFLTQRYFIQGITLTGIKG